MPICSHSSNKADKKQHDSDRAGTLAGSLCTGTFPCTINKRYGSFYGFPIWLRGCIWESERGVLFVTTNQIGARVRDAQCHSTKSPGGNGPGAGQSAKRLLTP